METFDGIKPDPIIITGEHLDKTTWTLLVCVGSQVFNTTCFTRDHLEEMLLNTDIFIHICIYLTVLLEFSQIHVHLPHHKEVGVRHNLVIIRNSKKILKSGNVAAFQKGGRGWWWWWWPLRWIGTFKNCENSLISMTNINTVRALRIYVFFSI